MARPIPNIDPDLEFDDLLRLSIQVNTLLLERSVDLTERFEAMTGEEVIATMLPSLKTTGEH